MEQYIRWIHLGKYAFWKPVTGDTTRQCLFISFLRLQATMALCSDGANAVTGKKSGLTVKVETQMSGTL
jgi:hypothetical protein